MFFKGACAIILALVPATVAAGAPDASCRSEKAPKPVTGEFAPQGIAIQTLEQERQTGR